MGCRSRITSLKRLGMREEGRLRAGGRDRDTLNSGVRHLETARDWFQVQQVNDIGC